MLNVESVSAVDGQDADLAPMVKVLSIQFGYTGIGTYSRGMREFFRHSIRCRLDSWWFDEEKALIARLLRRFLLLDDKWSGTWVRRRNLDFHWMRSVLGMSCLGRSLTQRKRHEARYQLLHFHTQSPALLCADLMRRIPSVIQTDLTAADLSREGEARWRWTFAPNRWLDQKAFDAARLIVVWSEWAARSLTEDYGIGREKVRVIYPGIDLEKYGPLSRERREDTGPIRLLFAGYDFERKGGYDVLEVFLAHFADRAELHLMTSAPISCDHPRVFVHSGLRAFTPEWSTLYERADLFVMPTYRDSFGMVYIEAMAAELPVIAGRVGAGPEIISDGEDGFLVTPGNRDELAEALRALIENPTLRREMGRRGRRTVESKFDARTNFRKLEAVFLEAAGEAAVVRGGDRCG